MKLSELLQCPIVFLLLFIAYKAESTYILVKLGNNDVNSDDVTEKYKSLSLKDNYNFKCLYSKKLVGVQSSK